ncbi:MAG: hypothetical protein GF411_14060 [Candidatus Lokiarchaeota archaeon]|nr:hypothetical protein [Candidatus Lokiarchaeota archaeon]
MITLIVGPKRTGKKTIAKALKNMCMESNMPCRIVDLDDEPLPFNVHELIDGDMIVLSSDDEFEVRDMMKKRWNLIEYWKSPYQESWTQKDD